MATLTVQVFRLRGQSDMRAFLREQRQCSHVLGEQWRPTTHEALHCAGLSGNASSLGAAHLDVAHLTERGVSNNI
jgi:hypothetical protein